MLIHRCTSSIPAIVILLSLSHIVVLLLLSILHVVGTSILWRHRHSVLLLVVLLLVSVLNISRLGGSSIVVWVNVLIGADLEVFRHFTQI